MNPTVAGNPNPIEAVQRLFLKNSDVLQGFITGLVADLTLAQDVYQELFITLTRLAPQFRPGTDFLAWARAIAWRKALEVSRSHKGGARTLDSKVLEALAGSAAETSDAWSRRREALAACMEQLPPRAREVVQLRYSEELLSPREIARKLSWKDHAVDVALSRARKWLRECTHRAMKLKPV